MWEEIGERVEMCAKYIAETGATVRACALHFETSKSTVHKDMTERLPALDPALFEKVKAVLEKNLKERHLRGGESTKRKYEKKRGK